MFAMLQPERMSPKLAKGNVNVCLGSPHIVSVHFKVTTANGKTSPKGKAKATVPQKPRCVLHPPVLFCMQKAVGLKTAQ